MEGNIQGRGADLIYLHAVQKCGATIQPRQRKKYGTVRQRPSPGQHIRCQCLLQGDTGPLVHHRGNGPEREGIETPLFQLHLDIWREVKRNERLGDRRGKGMRGFDVASRRTTDKPNLNTERTAVPPTPTKIVLNEESPRGR